MNASILLDGMSRAFAEAKLEVVMIGSAAAALNGAPITTEDFDFMWRPTSSNLTKLRRVARSLDASLQQPEYPVSRFYRLVNSDSGLQLDMMGVVDGVKSFESLRSRANRLTFGGSPLMVASLGDVIKSKRLAGRPKDLAVLPVLEETLRLREEK